MKRLMVSSEIRQQNGFHKIFLYDFCTFCSNIRVCVYTRIYLRIYIYICVPTDRNYNCFLINNNRREKRHT